MKIEDPPEKDTAEAWTPYRFEWKDATWEVDFDAKVYVIKGASRKRIKDPEVARAVCEEMGRREGQTLGKAIRMLGAAMRAKWL